MSIKNGNAWTPGPWARREDMAGSHYAEAVEAKSPKGKTITVARIASGRERREADARLISAAPDLLAATKIAYTILADIRHDWAGRHTAEGQGALCAMRDAIAKAECREAEEVQDEYSNPSRRGQ